MLTLDGVRHLAIARQPANAVHLRQAATGDDYAICIQALQGLSWLRRRDEASFIAGYLTDDDARIRVCAAKALALTGIGDAEAQALNTSLRRDPSSEVQAACMRTLSWLGAIDDLSVQRYLTKTEPGEVIEAALQAVERLALGRCIPSVIPYLTAQRPTHRQYAARALSTFEPNDVWSHLATMTDDDDPEVRAIVLRFLGKANIPNTAPIIAQALNDPNPGVRATAAIALGTLGDPRYLTAILSQQHERHPEVRLRLKETASRLRFVRDDGGH
ncbi:MAG: HEAT repeat domain-containing protein [Myxococcota bacterium]|nr:HEAT repeat domain-containing protein [Myxococcota bacterium]